MPKTIPNLTGLPLDQDPLIQDHSYTDLEDDTGQASETKIEFPTNATMILLYNFDQFISHVSQAHLMKRNLVSVTSHLAT
jgi:hypothetical protein